MAGPSRLARPESIDWEAVEVSAVGCEDDGTSQRMCEAIDQARIAGESLGGVFEIWCWGLCPGLGGYARFEDRLDGKLLGGIGRDTRYQGGRDRVRVRRRRPPRVQRCTTPSSCERRRLSLDRPLEEQRRRAGGRHEHRAARGSPRRP